MNVNPLSVRATSTVCYKNAYCDLFLAAKQKENSAVFMQNLYKKKTL